MYHKKIPNCYYVFTSEVKQLKINAINALAENIRQVFSVDTSLPKDIKLLFKQKPKVILFWQTTGGYDPFEKEIVLSGTEWCRKTLIHEILHSFSFFFRDERLKQISLMDWRFVVEGLTEFLTGYFLYKTRNQYACYIHWLNKDYNQCKISYEPYVRIFGALAQTLVSLQDFKRIFFYDKRYDWNIIYRDFLKKYNIPDLFNDWKIISDLEDKIINKLRTRGRKHLANKIEALLNDDIQIILNYDKMKK